LAVCFVDNNIILQLAAYDLFEAAIAAFNLTWDDLRILNTAIYVFRGTRIARRYSPKTIERAIAIAQRCQTVQRPPSDEFQRLLQVDGMDEGEAALIAATETEPVFLLTTGDTAVFPRMRYSAKPGNPSKSSIRQIKLYSVAVRVQQQVLATPDGEKAIKISFGWSTPADPGSILEGLQSYINDVQKRSQGLLADLKP